MMVSICLVASSKYPGQESADLFRYVVPAQAGTQPNRGLDLRIRGDDE